MTRQQFRLWELQQSRAYGPFTDAELYHLLAPHKRRRTKPSDVARPGIEDRIRPLRVGETIATLRTVPMEGE